MGHKILSGQRKLEMEGRQVVSPHLSLPAPVDPTWVGGGSEPPPVLMTHILYVTAGGQDAGGVHVLQCLRGCQGHHAVGGQAEPENVLLVHGEAKKMEFLKQKIEQEFRRCPARVGE